MVQAELLVQALARLSRAATGDFAVDAMLLELCEAAARALPVDGCGVMAGAAGRARFVHADGPPGLAGVEHLQQVLQQGPCQDAMVGGRLVAVSDLRAQRGWPQYLAAVTRTELRAVLAVPLVTRGRNWGSLDVYRYQPGPWTRQETDAAQLLADVAVSYIVMAADRDAARQAQSELARRAVTDPLTGLPNRGLLVERISHALALARRTGRATALVFIDLDRFKQVNDTLGHGSGDAVLVEVARRLSSTLRAGDTLARLAGDEFVLLCEDLPADDGPELNRIVDRVTERLRAVLAPPVRLDGQDLVVSASIGVAATARPTTAQELLHQADTAMYRAKQNGRDRVVVDDQPAAAGTAHRRQLQRDLPHALDRGQLTVQYQPIVAATDHRVRAVEALLRWNHPTHGQLPAAAFIALAESSGALPRIGRWVIGQACAQLHTWQQDRQHAAPDIVFCNLSPRELTDPALPAAVHAALTAHSLQPCHLGLEVVEDNFADPLTAPTLGNYQQAGHPLSVDDFGTGYSSLSRLVSLAVSHAKIDRSFVAGLPEDPRARALVDAVLTVAANLGLHVIAEGVETQPQADYLTNVGCHLLQGFHLAPPMPPEQVINLLDTVPTT